MEAKKYPLWKILIGVKIMGSEWGVKTGLVRGN